MNQATCSATKMCVANREVAGTGEDPLDHQAQPPATTVMNTPQPLKVKGILISSFNLLIEWAYALVLVPILSYKINNFSPCLIFTSVMYL